MTANGQIPADKKRLAELLRQAYLHTDDLRKAEAAARLVFEMDATAGLAIETVKEPEVKIVTVVQSPPLEDIPLSIDAYFSWDIFNRREQSILNKAMAASKKLTAMARKALQDAFRLEDQAEMLKAVTAFLTDYRVQLANILSATQLAAVLEGAREVAAKIPEIPPDGVGVPIPPTLEPEQAQSLLEEVKSLPELQQAERLYELPADQQEYVTRSLQISGVQPIEPEEFTPEISEDNPHLVMIDEAAKELSAKNVMDRVSFDALDAASRQKAFTVAGVDSDEVLEEIRDALAKSVLEGGSYKRFQEAMAGKEDEFLSEGHFENVFRTGVQSAFSDGQMKVLNNPFVKSGFPYASYNSIDDPRRRHNHGLLETLGIDGTNIYRIDDPVFQTFRPPWDYMDRCSWIPMSVQQAAREGLSEAARWLAEGKEPTPPAYVAMPAFRPPPGFQRAIIAAPLSIQLSMKPIDAFLSWDLTKHPRGQPDNNGQFGEKSQVSHVDSPGQNPTATTPVAPEPHLGEIQEGEHKRQQILKKYGAQLAMAIDKVPVVGFIKQKMEAAMRQIHAQAVQRYGSKTAAAIMASGTIVDLALMGGGMALTGIPVVTGVNQLIGIIPAFLIAEGKYQVQRAIGAEMSLLAILGEVQHVKRMVKAIEDEPKPDAVLSLESDERLTGLPKQMEEITSRMDAICESIDGLRKSHETMLSSLNKPIPKTIERTKEGWRITDTDGKKKNLKKTPQGWEIE